MEDFLAGSRVARRSFRLFAAFGLTVALSVSAMAEDRTFVVGVEDVDDMPQSGVKDGAYIGIGREILDAFASDHQYRFTYRPLPIRRLVRAMIKGETDFKYPDNPIWDGETKKNVSVLYSRPIVKVVDAGMVEPQNIGKTIEDIRILGTLAGYTPSGWQARLQSKQTIVVEFPDPVSLLNGVLIGHMDAAYLGLPEAKFKLETMGKPGALIVNPSLPSETFTYHLSTTRHAEILEEFNAWQKAHPDKIRVILAKYGTEAGD